MANHHRAGNRRRGLHHRRWVGGGDLHRRHPDRAVDDRGDCHLGDGLPEGGQLGSGDPGGRSKHAQPDPAGRRSGCALGRADHRGAPAGILFLVHQPVHGAAGAQRQGYQSRPLGQPLRRPVKIAGAVPDGDPRHPGAGALPTAHVAQSGRDCFCAGGESRPGLSHPAVRPAAVWDAGAGAGRVYCRLDVADRLHPQLGLYPGHDGFCAQIQTESRQPPVDENRPLGYVWFYAAGGAVGSADLRIRLPIQIPAEGAFLCRSTGSGHVLDRDLLEAGQRRRRLCRAGGWGIGRLYAVPFQ